MHSVWLARGGRKRSKATRIQLIIHSIRYGNNLTSIELDSVSTFQTAKSAKHKKKKNGCNFETLIVSCMICIKRDMTIFSALQKETNSFTTKTNSKPLNKRKWTYSKIVVKI